MVEIRCGTCGYKWDYSGNRWHATCPNCNGKCKTPLNPEHDDYDPELDDGSFLESDGGG